MHDWQTVHEALKNIAKKRVGLDAAEARWLREAKRVHVWKPLGHVSMIDYMEREMGYVPHTAQDRLRVADALADLPEVEGALACDGITYSGAKELSSVTPETQQAWLENESTTDRGARVGPRARRSANGSEQASFAKAPRVPRALRRDLRVVS